MEKAKGNATASKITKSIAKLSGKTDFQSHVPGLWRSPQPFSSVSAPFLDGDVQIPRLPRLHGAISPSHYFLAALLARLRAAS